jgi:hypothetical protein
MNDQKITAEQATRYSNQYIKDNINDLILFKTREGEQHLKVPKLEKEIADELESRGFKIWNNILNITVVYWGNYSPYEEGFISE